MIMNQKLTVLVGHNSPETAYVVDDYPYGFRLRCKIRYWVEYKPGKGCRMVSQTTNPKRAGEVWNKPKASTYCRFGLVMMLDENGHVVNGGGCTEYDSAAECAQLQHDYANALPCDEARQILAAWVKRKLAFEEAKAQGKITLTTTTTENFGPAVVTTEILKPASDFEEAKRLAALEPKEVA